MTTLNNSMTITGTALTHVSKELINKRDFNSSSIVTVGSPSILNGVASSFSSDSYFLKEGLDLSNATEVTLKIKSTYLNASQGQTLLMLGNTQSSNIFKILCNSNSIKVLKGTSEILSLNVSLQNEDQITLELRVSETSIQFLVFVNEDTYSNSAIGQFSEVIKGISSIYVGSDSVSNLYWHGTVDLKTLILYVNEKEYYSTGVLNGYTFTKLLVSDSSVTLTDDSTEMFGHVVECPVEEVVRTENNVLLKATIGSGEYLNIEQIGLYCKSGDEDVLFSLISDLSIKKSSDLGYSLILHVKVDVNVVNVSVTPEIEIAEDESASASDFEKVKRDHTYITSNLERMIKDNSLGLGNYKCYLDISNPEDTRANADGLETLPTRTMTDAKPSGVGYNKPQSNYKIQTNINELQEAYSTSISYSKVQEKGKVSLEYKFSEENIEKVGSVAVNSDGEASVFSEVDYVKSIVDSIGTNAFDITVAFKAEVTTANSETIYCLSADSNIQPLILSVNNDKIHVLIGQQEKVTIESDGILATYTRGTPIYYSGTIYYRWSYRGSENVPNIVLIKELVPTSGSTLYNENFEEISASIKTFVSGSIIDKDILSVSLGTKQYIRVTFDGNTYNVYAKNENEEFIQIYSKVSPLTMERPKVALFGIGYSNATYSNHFYGTIYLSEFTLSSDTYSLSFLKEETVGSVILQDYYHIPIGIKSYYNAYNLNNYINNYAINIQEGMLKGRKDSINLSNANGFSISIKAKLSDSTNKIVLAKCNPKSGLGYFTFELKNNKILFTIYSDEETVTLSKELTDSNFKRYVSYYSLFTLVCSKVGDDSAECKFYMNRELLDSVLTPSLSFSGSNYILTNYLEDPSEAEENYVSDILSFIGELSENDLFYLCTVLDTNF